MATHAFPKFKLPDPEIRGTGTFCAPPLADTERAIIQARAVELENSADAILHQAGIDNCRLLAEIDRLWSVLISKGLGEEAPNEAGHGCGVVTT